MTLENQLSIAFTPGECNTISREDTVFIGQ